MNKLIAIALLSLLVLPQLASALTASEAKQAWYGAKESSAEAQQAHRDAKIEWAADKTPENDQKVVSTGKDSLNAALDEAEAWLIWVDLDAGENPLISEGLKQTISADVEANLLKIPPLREEVDGAGTQFELGVVWLKMVGKYVELLADVCRDTGYVWVHIADAKADEIDEYEQKLRSEAANIEDNAEIIEKLDSARDELGEARENIDNANDAYGEVRLPGTPLIKFSEGNGYLHVARTNLLSAVNYLNQAFALMLVQG